MVIRLLALNYHTFPLLSICGELTSVHTTLRDLCVLTAITAPLRMASPFIPDTLMVLSQYMAPFMPRNMTAMVRGQRERERERESAQILGLL